MRNSKTKNLKYIKEPQKSSIKEEFREAIINNDEDKMSELVIKYDLNSDLMSYAFRKHTFENTTIKEYLFEINNIHNTISVYALEKCTFKNCVFVLAIDEEDEDGEWEDFNKSNTLINCVLIYDNE